MPIYTYKCETCGIQFERQQSFSDQPLTRCPECNKKSLRKVYTPVGIVFKGSGFYATDHHSPSGQINQLSEKGNGDNKEPAAKNEDNPDKKDDSGSKTSMAKSEKDKGKKE